MRDGEGGMDQALWPNCNTAMAQKRWTKPNYIIGMVHLRYPTFGELASWFLFERRLVWQDKVGPNGGGSHGVTVTFSTAHNDSRSDSDSDTKAGFLNIR